MTDAERGVFVEDKLAYEHEKSLARQEKLLDAIRKVLAQKDLMGLLQTTADCARELTGAKYAATGHGYVNGVFTTGGVSRSEEAMACPPGDAFNVVKGGIYLDLVKEKDSIRLSDAEMRSHPAWWGLPEGQVPLRGVLGARLVDVNGQSNGLLMVSDREDGTDFTIEDENTLSQLAAIVSLALQHIEARLVAENEKCRLEALMKALPVGVSLSDDPSCQSITGNPAALAQFEVGTEDNISASAPNSNAPGRQVRYFIDGRQISDADLPLQRAVAENREIPPVELEVELPSGRRWFTEASGAPIRDAQGNMIGGVAITVDITERKHAEEASFEANQKYRSLFNNKMVGLSYCQTIFDDNNQPIDYIVLDINATYEKLVGIRREQIVGKRITEAFPGVSRDLINQHNRVAVTGQDSHFEICEPTIDKWFDVNVFSPRKGYFVAIFYNITERKRAEDNLRLALGRLQTFFDHRIGGIGIVIANAKGGILQANDYYLNILGLTRDELLSDQVDWRKMTPSEWLPVDERALAQLKERGVCDPYKKEYIRRNGTRVPILITDAMMPGDSGDILAFVWDITESKRAEEALIALEEKTKNLLKRAPTGIYEIDFHGPRFLMVNDFVCEATGYTREELLEMSPFDLLADESKVLFQDRIRRQLAGEKVDDTVEYRGKVKDGREMFWVLKVTFTYDAEGQPVGAIVVGEDITERKRAEEALSKSKDQLEQRVQERTQELSQANKRLEAVNVNLIDEMKGHTKARTELQTAKEALEITNEELQSEIEEHKQTEEQLLKAKEAAEAAARTKAEFLANMSHEIRTPMNSVIGFTQLLLDEPLDPTQRENLELIRTNGDALLSIINDILDFSKMESDKVILEKYQFKLRQCVEEALDLVALKAAEKGLNLAYIIDKNVPDTIVGDFGRLRQILGNLLSNAVKFTDEGEVTVSVSVDEIDQIHFAVRDTGIGIPRDRMDQLFQPFNQMEPSTTRLYGGTGLGLAISKKLVELMGGQIWAKSSEGIGSTFHFTIKASPGQVEPVTVSPQLIGKRVLIVEDNKTNRRILNRQVYDWGMIPMAASSGQEALRYVQRGDNFDIAILDMDLQTMDSFELEGEIRKYNKTLPLVLLASLGKRIPPNHAYLTKPIRPSQMHKVLTDILPRTGILSVQPAQKTGMASRVNQLAPNSSLRILLAEDNISNQKVALQMLKKLGYKADLVANGIEVLQSLERQHYDIVLMDLKMPGMDGLEASRIIRQRWPNNGPKIIAITAYALEGDQEKCLEAGMDDYISKPVQKEDLARVLAKYSSQ